MEQKIMQKITGEMTIGEVVKEHPEVVPALLSYGVHCIGCHVSAWESLEDGFRGHGFDEEKINEILAKLNEVVEQENSGKKDFMASGKLITVTSIAAEKLKEVLKSNDKADHGLRVEVIPGGCSGSQFGLNIDKEANANDKVVEENGLKFFINKNDVEAIKGARLDFDESIGFKIDNPNSASAGCGSGCGCAD